MPISILEDPTAAALPGPAPISVPQTRHAYLKDHITSLTIFPLLPSSSTPPPSLISFLGAEFNAEILAGDTYPMDKPMTEEEYAKYWFSGFVGIAMRGRREKFPEEGEVDFQKEVCGTFYIKPNYPGRCCHVANGGFMTVREKRGLGVGKLMGEAYIEWAANLGYTYSVFNLVFETNTASVRIWESLGFKRLGKVKGAGRLRSSPVPVDALIYGRDLSSETDFVSDQRFEKIRYYLEKGKYPPNSDRSEKSRLRSASTHYRLVGDKLMLNNKEVVSDGHLQYEIAKREHERVHGGINKTTSVISEKYHWVRIKETVSQVIRNCKECRENTKAPLVKPEALPSNTTAPAQNSESTDPNERNSDLNSKPDSSPDTEMQEVPAQNHHQTSIHLQSQQQLEEQAARSASADLITRLQALHAAAIPQHPSQTVLTHYPLDMDRSNPLHAQHRQLQVSAHSHPHQQLAQHRPLQATSSDVNLHEMEIPIDPRMIQHHPHPHSNMAPGDNSINPAAMSFDQNYDGLDVHTETAQAVVAAARAAEDLTERLGLEFAGTFEGEFDVGMDEGGLGGG